MLAGYANLCYHKKYQHTNKKTLYLKNRIKRLQSKYSITLEQWEKLYERQKGICPICDRPVPSFHNTEGKRAAAVDHDHKSKRVRGLVCHVCNRNRIGKNTVQTARKLVDYLSSDFDGRNI